MANTRVPAAAGGMSKPLTRREALRTLGASTALGFAAAGAVHITVSAAAEPDPILAAIDAHQQVYDAWQATTEDDPRQNELDKAEQAAWDRVCETVPTTLHGLAQMAFYLQRHLRRDACASDQSIQAAWLSIAMAAAAFHAVSQRAA